MTSTLAAESLRRQRERLGDLEVYPEPRKTDEALWEFDTQQAMERTQAMIDSLGEAQPILRTMLENAKQEIQESNVDPANTDNTYYGRRLMQRVEYNTRVTDVLITHEIMQFYGKGGIPVPSTSTPTPALTLTLTLTRILLPQPGRHFGLVRGAIRPQPPPTAQRRFFTRARATQALCAATKFDDDATRTDRCNAFAFKRAAPFSYTDRTGWCYLLRVNRLHSNQPPVVPWRNSRAALCALQNAGACRVEDFGVGARSPLLKPARACAH